MKKTKFNREEFINLNNEDRMWFVEYWANYVRTHPDKDWSRQQNILINSMMKNANNSKLTPREYLAIKNEKCSR
mgnify:CR=1 FL=1